MDKQFLTILLAALMGACENANDTDNPADDTGTPTLYEASFTASLNQYGWSGDTVVLLGSADKAADFIATSDGGETVSGTTPDVRELTKGTWTSSYYYDESTMLYLGWSSGDVAESSDFGTHLCADLSGDWSCDDDLVDDPYETEDAMMNGCSIFLEGVGTLTVDGNKVSSESDGGSLIGIASADKISMIVFPDGMDKFSATCTRI